jgi:hypothetical protein
VGIGMKPQSPYSDLPSRQFWRSAVTEQNVLTVADLWYKRFDIDVEDKIVSAGSCFAQHISKRLVKSGFNYQAPIGNCISKLQLKRVCNGKRRYYLFTV